MTLFRVQCPTCAARLKVTSRSLIGQIVNCPKCGSMVEIAEPDSPASPEKSKAKAAPVAAPVVSQPETAAPETPKPEAPAAEPPITSAEVSGSDAVFDNLDEMLAGSPATEAQSPTPETPQPAEAAATEIHRFSDSASVSKMRNMALIGGTSIMALATFAVIGYAVFSSSDNTAPVTPEEPEPTQVAQFEPPVEEEPPAEKEPAPVEEAPEPAKEPVEPEPAPEETPTQEPNPPEATTEASPEPMMPRDENPFLFDDPDTTTPAEKPAVETPSDDDGKPKVAEAKPSILELKDDPLYEVFGEAFPVLDPEAFEPSASMNPGPPEAAPAMPQVDVSTAPELVPPIPEVDVAQRLRDPIVRIEFDNMPLNEFASFVTQMSTVPVTLDPLALASADINAKTPISVKQTQTSVEGILNSAVRPFGLEVKATDKSARLRITQPLDGHKRVAQLLVDDLAKDQKEVADIAYLMTHLVEPLSWKQSRGDGLYRIDPGKIMITQSEVSHFKAVVFLEKLRIARGLPKRSNFSDELFDLTLRGDQLSPALQKDVKLQVVVPTPFYKVVDQLEKKSGLTILCDWDSLAMNKLGPATPVTLTAPGVSMQQALEQFCKAWKLEALPINSTTVQLVSERSTPIMPWLEFYDVSKLQLGKSEAAALINNAKRELTDLRKTGYGDLQYDPVSKRLLALLSKDDHQRLQFALQRKISN
ncbi:hypothetical protein Pan97_13830 [Bremerella volcania]|uniref:Uncharacterized protein n=1 Tax=Bremerella volcania TaxID=2527984 RepID=A0A518C582_9BACT|nr:hypothetical protein [Bremerella volcania]QDU74376.1 hypothetical protein Pan97_13830 [Bremerella volcania]